MDKEHRKQYWNLKIEQANYGSSWAIGDLFELWVSDNVFPERPFQVIDNTPHYENLNGRRCIREKYPDFHFLCNKTDNDFWVECKFRSHLEDGKLCICYESYEWEAYMDFREKSNKKLFFVVGLGGEPWDPEEVYCFDIDETKFYTPYEKQRENNIITKNFESYSELLYFN